MLDTHFNRRTFLRVFAPICLFALLLLSASCGKEEASQTTELQLKASFATASQDGGVMVYMNELRSRQMVAFPVLNATQERLVKHIPNGSWRVTVVSWQNGSTRFMEGDVRCGETAFEAAGVPMTVTVPLSMAGCDNPNFSSLSYKNTNQFSKLKIITCNPETALADLDDGNCDAEAGNANSFRVALPGFYTFWSDELFALVNGGVPLPLFPQMTLGLNSRCIEITDSDSTQLSDIRVPVSSIGNVARFPTMIKMYKSSDCSDAPYTVFSAPVGISQYINNPNIPGSGQHMVRPGTDGSDNITTIFVKDSVIPPGPPTQLVMIAGLGGLPNTCLGPFVINAKDANNRDTNVIDDVTINLAYTATTTDGAFYSNSDTGCVGSPISTLTIATGGSVGNFYFKKTTVDTTTFTVSSGGLNSGTHLYYVTSGGVALRLMLTGTPSGSAGSCIGPYTVTTNDIYSNPANVVANTTVNLSYTANVMDGAFYSDAVCGSSATSVVVNTGSSAKDFYFKKATPQSEVILSVSSTGFTTGNFPPMIN